MLKVYEKNGNVFRCHWWIIFDQIRNISFRKESTLREFSTSWVKSRDLLHQTVTITDGNERVEINCHWHKNITFDKIIVTSSSKEFSDMILIMEVIMQ